MTQDPQSLRQVAIVLVHGAWFGPRCWNPVIRSLEQLGSTPMVVTLRGAGARRAENGPHISLADHIDDVEQAITSADLHNVVLVGHSYGGRVITGVANRISERLSRLVYIDAHAPVVPETPPSDERRQLANEHGGMLPLVGVDFDLELVGDADEYALARSEIVDHPFSTLCGPWHQPLAEHLVLHYIHATGRDAAPFAPYAVAAKANARWRYTQLDGPHMLQYTHPNELASIIVDVDRIDS
jgi:pimeloyl-ACP methyl ester carboxylesterase